MVSTARIISGYIRATLVISLLVIIGLSINAIYVLFYIFHLLPFTLHDYRNLSNRLAWFYSGLIALLLEKCNHSFQIKFSGQALNFWDSSNNTLYFSNSVSSADNLIFLLLNLRRSWSNIGTLRYFVNNHLLLQLAPGFGQFLTFHECISSYFSCSLNNFSQYCKSFGKTQSDISFALFPEITTNTGTSKHSAQYVSESIETDKFVVILDELNGVIKEIADVTIVYIGEDPSGEEDWNPNSTRKSMEYASYLPLDDESRLVPTLFDFLAGFTPNNIYININTYNVDGLPISNDERRQWLTQKFKEKQELLQEFNDNGEFPGEIYTYPLYIEHALRFLWGLGFYLWLLYEIISRLNLEWSTVVNVALGYLAIISVMMVYRFAASKREYRRGYEMINVTASTT
jgi:hypothetical protein